MANLEILTKLFLYNIWGVVITTESQNQLTAKIRW